MNSSSIERFSANSNRALEIATALTSDQPIDRALAAFLLKLQTHCNVDNIFNIIFETLHWELSISGIEYTYPLLDKHVNLGNKGIHNYSYLVEIEDRAWGDITIFRNTEFTSMQKNRLDQFISAIVFPLRNVILYENALIQAGNDAVLGLPNWGHLQTQITREAKLAARRNQPLTILLVDIDHFKNIQSAHGFLAGDILMRETHGIIQKHVRDTDILCHYGNDQYALILSNTQAPDGETIADRIKLAVASDYFVLKNDKKVRMTVSIGIAELIKEDSVNSFYERAFKALKLAKNSGRNQIKTADGRFLR